MWMLLAQTIPEADHHGLATGEQRYTIASIQARQDDKPLIQLHTDPLITTDGRPLSPGIHLYTPRGTMLDFEEMLGHDLFRFPHYDPHKKTLPLVQYGMNPELTVRMDPAFLNLEREIAGSIADEGKFRLTITEQTYKDDLPIAQNHTDAFYFENARTALLALVTHPYITAQEIGPFLYRDEPTVLRVADPEDKLIMETRIVTRRDPDAHHWPQPGLFLTFPDGLPAVNERYGLSIQPSADPSLEDHFIIISDFDRNYQHLMANPGFEQIMRQLTEQPLPPGSQVENGYFVSLSYLPTRIPPDLAHSAHLETVKQPVASFEDGLRLLQALSNSSLDRTQAMKNMAEKYLVEATLFDTGNEMARLFQLPASQGPLPPGTYLKINPDQVSTASINALAPLLSGQPYKSDFHFLLTQPGSSKHEPLRHNGLPRTLRDVGKEGLGI